jgi:surfactin synthase thioesterase subunit
MKVNKLFCLPYAGGSAVIYMKWTITGIDIIPMEYSGRGLRGDMPFYKSFEELIEDMYSIFKNTLQEADKYAMFGHSMGAQVVYELYRKIIKNNLILPKHIFLSGALAPDKKAEMKKISHLTDSCFMNEVKKLGGLSDEIQNAKGFAEGFLKAIRSDIQIFENYIFEEDNTNINCPVTVFFGEKDRIGFEEVIQWRKYIYGEFAVNSFNEDHFFINKDWKNVLEKIKRYLY